MTNHRILLSLVIWAALGVDGLGAAPLAVNRDLSRLASLPSFDVHPDGRFTFVWSAYDRHREWLLASSAAEGSISGSTELSPGVGTYCQPRFVATGAGAGWAFWTRQRDGRWEVVARRLSGGEWAPVEILSGASDHAMTPVAAVNGSHTALAFEQHATPGRIAIRIWDGRQWSAAAPASEAGVSSYRPVLVSGPDGQLWAFWDSYLVSERGYAVFARRILPKPGAIERVSPAGRNCLKPSAVHAATTGLAVAWVQTDEVIGGAGVLDHRDAIHVAIRNSKGWQPASDSAGDGAAAPLEFGLLARMEPGFEPVWGYAGRRRQPILIEDGGALLLLWERRIRSGGPASEPGRLCARRWNGEHWSAPVILHEGLVEYGVPEAAAAAAGRIAIVGRDPRHVFQFLSVDVRSGKPFEFEPWPGWKPVRLPLHAPAARPFIDLDGKRHYLYWGDLHVHSALTPDAEGEVDELMHFARDKAAIDVAVVQENDVNSWLTSAYVDHRLSASEYAQSVYFSRRYTEPGRFVALPGFEWSQRTRDDNKPNHRTVMYAGPDAPIVRHTENNGNFDELCQAVQAAGGNMFTQHEAFRLVGCSADTNIEVATGWGVYISDPETVHRALSAQHRLGFVATSDGHRRNPGTGGGLTGIYAPELTPEAILDALKKRRVYATNGSRVVLDARANGRFMGEDVEAGETVDLQLRVASPKPVARVVLVRDGREIHSSPANGGKEVRAGFTDRPGAGFHWYYWRVELEGSLPHYGGNVEAAEGVFAWSSPHRVTCAH